MKNVVRLSCCIVMLLSLTNVTDPTFGEPQQEESEVTHQSLGTLAKQIFAMMQKTKGARPGFRPLYAKGIVCKGVFVPIKNAIALSYAAHFTMKSVPITLRFSDGAADPFIADNSPDAGPRGMAIRFHLPQGEKTDIVAMSHNGFIVGSGEEFLELQVAIASTDRSKPHPWPIEQFLKRHPLAEKFVQDNKVIPTSLATESFFSNNAFIFVNKNGLRQAGRYKILPTAGQQNLSDTEAKSKSSNFLFQELKTRLTTGPVKYKLIVQLPNSGDPTNNPSIVWPEDRKTIYIGNINVNSIVADSNAAEKVLAFDPTNLTDGIELSDDSLPDLRSLVYLLSVMSRS
jgi:catalase